MMRNVNSYFKVVSPGMRACMIAVNELKEKEKSDARLDAKIAFDKEKRIRIVASYARSNAERKKRRLEKADNPDVAVAPVDPDVEAIESIVLEEYEEPVRVQKRISNVRPLNWRVVAEYCGQWGKHKTIRDFSNELKHRTKRSVDQALKQWLADFRSQRLVAGVKKAPAYGNDIDIKLLEEVKDRMASGLPVDDVTLRCLLLTLLNEHDKCHLLTANGGSYDFEHGWASRFWKRHNITSRVA